MTTLKEDNMKYNFDNTFNRFNTNSYKWTAYDLNSGGRNVYPMWVADMEFSIAPAIKKRLLERVEEGVFGYEMFSKRYYDAVKYWLDKRHACKVSEDEVLYCANTMVGLSVILQTFTEENDAILMNVPTYGNFFNTIKGCKRRVQESVLKKGNNRFTFNIDDMKKRITNETSAFLLCNPHNPTGTVWTEDELNKICKMCQTYNLLIISDEVHYDFIFENQHTMMRKIAKKYNVKVVTMISPGKSFNVAGIQTATLITDGIDVKNLLKAQMDAMSYPYEHAFAEAVTIGAYLESEDWFDEAHQYIKKNKQMVVEYIEKKIPILEVPKSEATYLLWVDCNRMNLDTKELLKFWQKNCGILPSSGMEFGNAGKGFIRLNLACSRTELEKVIDNMYDGFKERGFI